MPDSSEITGFFILETLAPALSSLSLGVGTVVTYSASLPNCTNFIASTLSIIFINVLIGLMMGSIVFTFIFGFGADSSQAGPGLISISLITLFAKLGIIGHMLGATFFLSLIFTGTTSAISMIELFAFYLISSFNTSRKKALILIGIIAYILGNSCILSSLGTTVFMIYDTSFFDVLGYISGKIIMPLGGILAAIFMGFVVKRKALEVLFGSYMSGVSFKVWYFSLRFIAPLTIIIIAVNAF